MVFVAPFAGARIEILNNMDKHICLFVAPFAGARIEIQFPLYRSTPSIVAPFAGARIEIDKSALLNLQRGLSLPSRERGLKF